MKQLILQIITHLQTEVPSLAYIADDWGQLDHYQDTPPVKFPCALISISSISHTPLTKDRTKETFTLYIRIADAPLASAHAAAPIEQQQSALAIYDIIESVTHKTQELNPVGFSSIKTISINRQRRTDAIRDFSALFEVSRLVVFSHNAKKCDNT